MKRGAQLFGAPNSAVRVCKYAQCFQYSASFATTVFVRASDCPISDKFRSKWNIQNEGLKRKMKIKKMAKSGEFGHPRREEAPKFSRA